MNYLKQLFNKWTGIASYQARIKDLEDEKRTLEETLQKTREDKQLHINTTNAYWKGIVRDLQASKKQAPVKG